MSEQKEFWIKLTSFDKVEMSGFRYSECEISIDPNCAENYDDFKNAIHLIKYDEFKKLQYEIDSYKTMFEELKKENKIMREALEFEKSVYARFWSKVNVLKVRQCWEWQSSISPNGYGKFSINNYPHSAHVVSYEYFNGKTQKEFVVDHKCMNRKCVNPNHLRAVDYKTSNPELVRSSIAVRLGLDNLGIEHSNRNIDGIVDMMLDALS